MAGTTNDKLNRLNQTKEAFRTAITGKGQTISPNEPFSAWPAKVTAISGGAQLPTLSNPGKAADLALGKELLDGNGNIVTGTALIPGGGDIKAQAKTVTPSTSQDQVITPDSGYNYLSQVTVKKVPYSETPNSAGGTTVIIG